MLKAADVDGNGQISEEEFILCMRTKKKSVNNLLLREMQHQVNRYIDQEKLEKKYNNLSKHEKNFLEMISKRQDDQQASQTQQDISKGGEIRRKNEEMDKAVLKSVYKDLWDMLLFLLEEEKNAQKNKTMMIKMAQQLKETKNNLLAEDREAVKMYKCIMCPIKWECPKVKRLRFPYSNLKANRKFGLDCPFAHHPMEL